MEIEKKTNAPTHIRMEKRIAKVRVHESDMEWMVIKLHVIRHAIPIREIHTLVQRHRSNCPKKSSKRIAQHILLM